MRWILSDIWSKKIRALMIAVLALSMNMIAPIPGGAQSYQSASNPPAKTVNPQTSPQQQTIKQVTPSKQSNQKPAQNSNLPNTGPGSVIAVFIASSLLAGVVYRRWLLYRHDSP